MFKFASNCPCGFCSNLDSTAATVQVEIENNLTDAGVTGGVKDVSEMFAVLAAVYVGKTTHDLIEDFSTTSELLIAANRMDNRDKIQELILSKLIEMWDNRTDFNAAEMMYALGFTKPDKTKLN